MTPTCNICGGKEFEVYRGRPMERCSRCRSKARHRVALAVYEKHLYPHMDARPGSRMLHMAPEPALHKALSERFGGAYINSDPEPERYPYAQCIQLSFPDSFSIFPDGYFDAILHNHVLEHIPGHYVDHLKRFTELLAPGGRLIFSIPGPDKGIETREGGEHLPTDEDRVREFGLRDHFKAFGDDFWDAYQALLGGTPIQEGLDDEFRATIGVRAGKSPFFIWQREGG